LKKGRGGTGDTFFWWSRKVPYFPDIEEFFVQEKKKVISATRKGKKGSFSRRKEEEETLSLFQRGGKEVNLSPCFYPMPSTLEKEWGVIFLHMEKI